MKRLLCLSLVLSLIGLSQSGCEENPLGDSGADSSFDPGGSGDDGDDPITLILNAGSYEYSDGSHAESCYEYLNSTAYNNEGDGSYWLDPDGNGGNPSLTAYCDMSFDGGGWTLISNRSGGTDNVESCGSDLNDFFQNSCGTSTAVSYSDSYNIGDSTVRSNILSQNEWRFVHYDSGSTEDTDDGFIVHASSDLFPNSTGSLESIAVTQVCDYQNTNCDSTDVYWLYAGDGFFSSSRCNSGYTGHASYTGNYGYCHNGTGSSYSAGSLFGDRSGYDETKLWDYNPNASDAYQEQVFIR